MADSLYDILGVARTASDAEIRAAYRRLAKKYHPDFNAGDRAAERMFKRVSAAYEILGDRDKRARYDRGEIDEEGRERVPGGGFWREAAAGAGGFRGGGDFGGFEDIISELFGRGGRRRGPRGFGFGGAFRDAAGEVRLKLALDFVEAVRGGRKRVTTPDGRSLEVNIPPGVENGQILRVKGGGVAGLGGRTGDLRIEVEVRDHPRFRRQGRDIHLDQPVPLEIAVLGGKLRVPTVDGEVQLTIPKGSSSGRVLRLRGKGVPDRAGGRGDQLVRLLVTLPDRIDPELESAIRRWAERRAGTTV